MRPKTLLLGAAVFYLLLAAAGGAAYFFSPDIKEALPALQKIAEKKDKAAERTLEAAQTAAAEAKQKEAEAKRQATYEAERTAVMARTSRTEELKNSLKEHERGGVTFYSFPDEGRLSSGVHLRPFIMEGAEDVLLKNEICYYYSIYDDLPTNWIHGSALSIQADGATFYLNLDPEKRRDHLASNAESLTERFVYTADKNTLTILKAIAASSQASLYYYQPGGSGCNTEVSREERRHIKEMVELYSLLCEENGVAE